MSIMNNIGPLLIVSICIIALSDSKMIIQSPSELSNYFKQKYADGTIPYSIANYGDIPYGKTISGTISTPRVLENCVY